MANFVSLETKKDIIRRKNFFLVVTAFSVLWIIFHFITVYIFGYLLDSIALVGIFLGIGNICAFFMDIPVGVMQRYFHAKILIFLSCLCMAIVASIFLYLIITFGSAQEAAKLVYEQDQSYVFKVLNWFFSDLLNVVLMLIAGMMYGIIKEIWDVTALSYIMNNADPSEYPELISKNNIFSGLGSVGGLVISTILLAIEMPIVIIFLLLFLIFGLMIFISFFFDRGDYTIELADVTSFKLTSAFKHLKKTKTYITKTIQKEHLIEMAKKVKVIFLRPIDMKQKFNVRELLTQTKGQYRDIYKTIFSQKTTNHKLLWLIGIISLFGFWDTFVVTFLAEFIAKTVTEKMKYPLLGVLAIPVFALQIPCIVFAKKIGYFRVVTTGLLLSGVAVLCFLIPNMGIYFIVFGLINSTGYAAGMPLSQALFSEAFNEQYALTKNISEIDSNTSAAPLKMLLNAANVFGLVFGGIFLGIIQFSGTFFLYGTILLVAFGFSIKKRGEWKL